MQHTYVHTRISFTAITQQQLLFKNKVFRFYIIVDTLIIII